MPVTSLVIGSRRVTGRKRFASLGRGATTPSLSTDGDNPAKMSAVSSRIHCLISSGAWERCSLVRPIMPPVLVLGMSMSDLCRSSMSE